MRERQKTADRGVCCRECAAGKVCPIVARIRVRLGAGPLVDRIERRLTVLQKVERKS